MNAVVWYFEHSLALPFFGIGMKTDVFQSCGHCWVFQICWHIECSNFTASSFRIWNSSTGIPSSPPVLFIVILSKAHLISHSKISGSRWVITPSWLSGSWRSFFYSSSVYSCHLFTVISYFSRSEKWRIVCLFFFFHYPGRKKAPSWTHFTQTFPHIKSWKKALTLPWKAC